VIGRGAIEREGAKPPKSIQLVKFIPEPLEDPALMALRKLAGVVLGGEPTYLHRSILDNIEYV
jgi:hypothetical protein